MPPDAETPILVIGVGNSFRTDDGVGLIIARGVGRLQLPGVTIREASGEGAALMDMWRGVDHVFLIDAVSSGGRPGEIHRLDAAATSIPSEFFHYSTHAFSMAEAVELARVLGLLPRRLVIFGIEGGSFEAGERLTAAVRQAADDVLSRIAQEIASIRAQRRGTSSDLVAVPRRA